MARLTAHIVALLCSIASAGQAFAVDARKTFQDQYGADLIKVRATREMTDDLELAKKMIDAAKVADTSAEMAALLCDNAFTLASRDAAGLETATLAMDALAAKSPASAAASRQKVVSLYQREAAKAKGDDKTKLTDAMLDLLVRYAEATIEAGDLAQAQTHLSQGQRTAKQAKSPRESEFDDRLADLANRERVSRDIEKWRKKLTETPSDAEAHRNLLRLNLVELNDPRGAIPYLELGGTDDEKRHVPLATKPMEELDAAQLASLAKWYGQVVLAPAAPATPTKNGAAIARAERYCDYYLADHRKDDDARKEIVKLRYKIEEALEKLKPARTPGSAGYAWTDVLRLVDPEKHWVAQKGGYKREGPDLVYVVGPHSLGVRAPVLPLGSYKLRIRLVRAKGNITAIYLPLGDERKGTAMWIREVGEMFLDGREREGAAVSEDREHQLDFTVVVRADEGRIALDLDDRPYAKWAFQVSQMKAPPEVPQPYSLGMFGQNTNLIRYKSFVAKSIDGRLRMLEQRP